MLGRFVLFGGTSMPEIISDLKKLVILNYSRSFLSIFPTNFRKNEPPAKTERVSTRKISNIVFVRQVPLLLRRV